MTSPFPHTPSFKGYNAPSRIEADIFDLEIEGTLPADLNGDWYRMTPDPQYPPRLGDDFFISGDGMISRFRFDRGHVDFRSRYVHTERFLAERKARRGLFGAYRNPFTDDPSVRTVDRTVANTSPLWHGGRLVTMKEDGRPYEIDPETLETRGRFDWHGKLRSHTVSAHPKVDPRTGELLFYGYEVDAIASRMMAYCVADRDGRLVREDWFEAPYPAMVHDFAITRDYVVFPLFPTLVDLERLKAGGPHWMSDVSRDAYIGVMPRNGSVGQIRWFRRRGGQAFHVINAWNEGATLHLDLCLAEMNPFPYIPDVSGAPYDPARSSAKPVRFTMELGKSSDGIQERTLGEIGGDVPRINEQFTGRRYRYTYMGMVDATRPMPFAGPVGPGFNQVGRFDVESGEVDAWYGSDSVTYQEPQFVSRGNGEAEGYVLCVFERHHDQLSDVGVFDAQHIGRGPLALVRLPLRLRSGIHGTWITRA